MHSDAGGMQQFDNTFIVKRRNILWPFTRERPRGKKFFRIPETKVKGILVLVSHCKHGRNTFYIDYPILH
jgi:hypothetical protein